MPLTMRQHQASLHQPALCELLPIRDYLDNVIVRSNGALVAGYDLGGINSYYHSDETRNQTKYSLEALVRSLTERSMRMQVRFEVVEGVGDLPRRYKDQLRSDNSVVQSLDRLRLAAWQERGRAGFFLRSLLHTYFYWDPQIHHEEPGNGLGSRLGKMGGGWSLSAAKCIQRSQREHEDQIAEFESILKGVEQTLNATGMAVRRMESDEMFLELKRAMNPLLSDQVPYHPAELSIDYCSAREQAANTHIEDDQETYIKIGGLLYSFISLKDLPDATFPGILRELLGLDFPMVVNTEVCIPDQAERLKLFKGRLRRMTAAQRDSKGGFKVNVDARVAEGQLMQTLQDLISSSLKSAQVSVVVAVRTSVPIQSRRDFEEQERVLADRRQRALHAILRMNGARGLPEDLAKRRLYVSGLPGMAVDSVQRDRSGEHAASFPMLRRRARCPGCRPARPRSGARLGANRPGRETIMTKTTHFGSNRNFALSKAVLVYSDGQEAFATVHEAKRSPDGGAPYLDAGRPLSIDFLTQLAKGLGRTTQCEILPPNILAYTPDVLVWWTRGQHRVMFYGGTSDGRSLNGKVFPQPPLVFKVCGSALSVRALGEDRRPQPNTPLMVAPYWNCDRQGGRVCQGSMRVPGNLCLAARKAWENAFFESEFTHAALGAMLTAHPEGFLGLWRDLTGSEADFPVEYLINSGDSLRSFVHGREE